MFAVLVLVAVAGVVALTGGLLERELPIALAQRLYPMHYQHEIREAALRFDVDPYLVAAVVKAESGFDPDAVSTAGAVGLMQLMPETAQWIVGRGDWQGDADPVLTDPAANVELGTYYLAYLLNRFGGDIPTALAAYNAGEGVVDGWLARGADAATGGTPTMLRPEDIPFPETRGFVDRVERFRDRFLHSHPSAFAT